MALGSGLQAAGAWPGKVVPLGAQEPAQTCRACRPSQSKAMNKAERAQLQTLPHLLTGHRPEPCLQACIQHVAPQVSLLPFWLNGGKGRSFMRAERDRARKSSTKRLPGLAEESGHTKKGRRWNRGAQNPGDHWHGIMGARCGCRHSGLQHVKAAAVCAAC